MTIITDSVSDIAGLEDNMEVVFFLDEPRVRASGNGIVTTSRVPVLPDAMVLTTPDLNPGKAKVKFGMFTYDIVIPDSSTPVALWPLIDAGLPAPTNEPGVVRNSGGIARVERITESAYAALETPDPETLFITFPG